MTVFFFVAGVPCLAWMTSSGMPSLSLEVWRESGAATYLYGGAGAQKYLICFTHEQKGRCIYDRTGLFQLGHRERASPGIMCFCKFPHKKCLPLPSSIYLQRSAAVLGEVCKRIPVGETGL